MIIQKTFSPFPSVGFRLRCKYFHIKTRKKLIYKMRGFKWNAAICFKLWLQQMQILTTLKRSFKIINTDHKNKVSVLPIFLSMTIVGITGLMRFLNIFYNNEACCISSHQILCNRHVNGGIFVKPPNIRNYITK